MAVPLANVARAVSFLRHAALRQVARPGPQPHGAPQIVDALQLAQLIDHAVRRARIEFGRIRRLQPANVARELDHHGLHAQANTEIGDLAFARIADRVQHAVYAALAEAARHQDAIVAIQLPFPPRPVHALVLDPDDVHL